MKASVVIGRFQPFHKGHKGLIKQALEVADLCIVLVGSAFAAREPKNPLSFQERRALIDCNFSEQERERLVCLPIIDTLYNDQAWASQVRANVNMELRRRGIEEAVVLVGYDKDHSSYYLRLFPEWELADGHPLSVRQEEGPLSATQVRRQLYQAAPQSWQRPPLLDRLLTMVSEQTLAWLADFAQREQAAFARLVAEHEFLTAYRAEVKAAEASWGGWPIFIQTVDALVVQSGHILLVERGHLPGEGLWALPGGHLQPDERLRDGAIRELLEECRLEGLSPADLKSYIRDQRRYDHPERSERGRVITEAFLFELPLAPQLWPVVGQNDARSAFWVPLAEIDPTRMWEDHYDMIQDMIGGQRGGLSPYIYAAANG